MAESDDPLARTATATASDGSALAPPLGDTLGRYRLERELGEGGMGVVHAAFDPDLERRVALKVLRTTDVGGEARQRLLREARAMARLTHPNVVTVHEVGSAGGRDYVAMELVEGTTLADWLRAEPRSRREILDAFRAAGRGLAAAHAAGLVHRDFKPHNVLRRRDGRICVTDFGLAREVAQDPPAEVRGPRSQVLTLSGSLLGTPAYMAPEQWTGGEIGPRADQFSFCVALWEAITGARPFQGDTIDDLKREVARGADGLDVSTLPRRLRHPLVRGLDPDPAKRWPSMDALLAEIARGERQPWLVFAIAGGAVVAAVALYLALGHASGSACAAPLLDPDHVWNDQRAAALNAAHQAPGATAIAGDVARWREVRVGACKADPAERAAKLACLDGVLANLEVTSRALAAVHDAPSADAAALLVDPAVCEARRTPRLSAAVTDARVAIAATELAQSVALDPLDGAAADKLVASAGAEPCVAATAHLVAAGARRTTAERRRELEEAESAAQRCGDDRLLADVAATVAATAITERDPAFAPKLERAQTAIEAVAQPDLQATIDELRASLAQRDDRVDEAIARYVSAHDGNAKRGRLRAAIRDDLAALGLRQLRAHPDDLAQVTSLLASWRELAVTQLGGSDPVLRDLDRTIADWKFAQGDVEGYHVAIAKLERMQPLDHHVRVTGRVLDDHGAPAAGALVVVAPNIAADAVGILPRGDARTTKTRADGTFEIPEAADGIVVAESDSLRSHAVHAGENLELRLEPTSHVEGKVDLHGLAPSNAVVIAHDPAHLVDGFVVVSPVKPDGSFALDGVPRGKLTLQVETARASASVVSGTQLTVDQPVVKDVRVVVTISKRTLYVIARSTVGMSLTQGQVLVMPGVVAPRNVAALISIMQDVQQHEALPIQSEHAPKSVLARAKPGDVYTVIAEAPETIATACAFAMPTEVVDPDLQQKMVKHLDRIELGCTPVGEHDEVVVVEVPPFPRLD